jgi:hypothetical protein
MKHDKVTDEEYALVEFLPMRDGEIEKIWVDEHGAIRMQILAGFTRTIVDPQ